VKFRRKRRPEFAKFLFDIIIYFWNRGQRKYFFSSTKHSLKYQQVVDKNYTKFFKVDRHWVNRFFAQDGDKKNSILVNFGIMNFDNGYIAD
jgi:hypothetical protein